MLSAAQKRALSQAPCAVAYDPLTLQLYATDASIYEIPPWAVAFPKNAAEARGLIRVAAECGIPLIPRGAGTGLVGGAIGEGLVIDFSRHNSAITEFNRENKTIRVGPGVVLDRLNSWLQPHGLCFGPDVATSSRATLGGMIANNSSGARVPVYGTTADHVQSLDLILAEGRSERVTAHNGGLAEEQRLIANLISRHAVEIEQRMPSGLMKRWPGYGLDRWIRRPGNLADLLAGSEGTLAAITSAELRLCDLPREKGLGLVFFASIKEAMQAATELLDLQPAAIEHIDRVLFDQTKGQLNFRAARDWMQLDAKPCESILLVEFFEGTGERLAELSRRGLGLRTQTTSEPRAMNLIWGLRKAGLSLLTGRKGPAKPVTGIEDTAVRPELLPEYVDGLQSILGQLGVEVCYYGHAASGLLHVRPVLDLRQPAQLAQFRKAAEEVSALVKQFKGSLAAEHGVGIARTEFLEEHLGPELVQLSRDLKAIFDPKGLFNPGKLLGSAQYRIDRNLRRTVEFQTALPSALAFQTRDGSFLANVEQCNGCGGCRKESPTMCPTFRATGDEALSTRGRANVIRWALRERGAEFTECAELQTVLEHCLSCKACVAECPSNVDMALIKAELLQAAHKVRGLPLAARSIGSIDWIGRMGSRAPRLANLISNWSVSRSLLARVAGFTPLRPLPKFAKERFDRWFRRRSSRRGERGEVILWDDTFTRYFSPSIGQAAVEVLERAGYTIRLVEQRRCCGRPAFSQGLLEKAREAGRHNLALLRELSANGNTLSPSGVRGHFHGPGAAASQGHSELPILFLEPSCYSMFISEYRELSLEGSEAVASRCFLFEQFIAELLMKEPNALEFRNPPGRLAVHHHCHAKALLDLNFIKGLTSRLPSTETTILDTGCCGMAGAFGAMQKNYTLSLDVGRDLARQIDAQPVPTIVVASGTSCREQIEHLCRVRPLHMAEVLAAAL